MDIRSATQKIGEGVKDVTKVPKNLEENLGVPRWLTYLGTLLVTVSGAYQTIKAGDTEVDRKIKVVHERITNVSNDVGVVDNRVRDMEKEQAIQGERLKFVSEFLKANDSEKATRVKEPNYDEVRKQIEAEQATKEADLYKR